MAQASSNNKGVPFSILVLASLENKHEDQGDERDRHICFEIDGKKSRLERKKDSDLWSSKSMNVNFDEKQTPKEFKITEKVNCHETKSNSIITILEDTLVLPEESLSITEFILKVEKDEKKKSSVTYFPVMPVRLLLKSADGAKIEVTKDSEDKPQKSKWAKKLLSTEFKMRLCQNANRKELVLRPLDKDALSFHVKKSDDRLDQQKVTVKPQLKLKSYKKFRHYTIFLVWIDFSEQAAEPVADVLIPAILNFDVRLIEENKEGLKIRQHWCNNAIGETKLKQKIFFETKSIGIDFIHVIHYHVEIRKQVDVKNKLETRSLKRSDFANSNIIKHKFDLLTVKVTLTSSNELNYQIALQSPLEQDETLYVTVSNGANMSVKNELEAKKSHVKFTCEVKLVKLLLSGDQLLTWRKEKLSFTLIAGADEKEKQLMLATGIEPGIMTYNVRIDGLDGEPTVEPYLPTYQLPREQILHYFHSLLQKAGLKAGLNDYSYEDVKNKYARRLVPQVRLDGGYDMRYLASRPYDLHDIWGKDGENPFNNPPDRIEVSAIEHCSELGLRPENAEKTTKLIRQEVCSRLHTMYKWREKQVFDLLGKIFDKFPYEARVKGKNYELYENNVVVTDEKYYFKVVAGLGMLLKQSELRDDFASYLMKNAAAVVRGRLEAFLVSPEFSRLTSKHFGAFRSHLNAAGVWFVFLMGLWCRNGGTEDFEEKIKETNTSLPESTTKLHIGDTSLHLDLSSVELKMNLMPRDGILWYFYSLLNGRFSAVVTEKYRKFDVLKKTYAKPLVPKITIGNRYDKRFTASKPIRYFDIWNSTEEQEGHPIAMPISRCALEFEDPKEAFDCLKNVFEGREQKVFTVVRVSAQAIDDKIIEGMNKFVESQDKNSSTLKELAQNAAAIVRGRCESLLVHPDLTSHDEQSEGKWKTEIRTIGLWFSFLMVVCSQKKVTQKDYSEVIRDPKLPQQVEFKAGEIPKDYLTDLLKRTINSIQGLAKKSGAKGVLSDNLPVFIPTFKHNANKTISRYAENSTAGKSYEFHDIWGTGGVESGSQKITKCSLEFPKRGEAYEQLRERFRSRSKLIFRILFEKCQVPVLRIATLENGEWRWSDETKETFYQHLTHSEAVPSLQVKSVKFTEPVFKLLLQNAAAIVRGRVESLLVNPGLQNNQEPNFNANWETEIDLICAWFQFLVLVWCARPKGHNLKHFRSDITEPRSQPHGRYTSEQYEQYVNAVFTAVFNAVIEND